MPDPILKPGRRATLAGAGAGAGAGSMRLPCLRDASGRRLHRTVLDEPRDGQPIGMPPVKRAELPAMHASPPRRVGSREQVFLVYLLDGRQVTTGPMKPF